MNTELRKVDIQHSLSLITLLESKMEILEARNRQLEEEISILEELNTVTASTPENKESDNQSILAPHVPPKNCISK